MEAGTVNLRDVRGPSAGSRHGWRRFIRLVWHMARGDLQAQYEAPTLGYLWTLLAPLLMAMVLYVAFTRVVRFGDQIENYAGLLILNIMLFFTFSQGTARTLTSFVSKRNIIQTAECPLLAAPMSSVLGAFITLCLNMVVVFGILLVAFGVEVRWTWLLFPLIILGFVVVTAAVGLLLSSIYVRFRDVGQMWSAISRAMFYASPVLFPIEFFPPSWHFLLIFNPLAPLLATARVWVMDPDAPTYAETVGGGLNVLIPLGVLAVIALLGVLAFRWIAPRAAEL
jgi:ABC-2 type transport system permease protein